MGSPLNPTFSAAPLPPPVEWRVALHAPLPHLAGRPLARGVIRSLVLALGGCITEVRGLERVAPARDPFILALNHSTKLEALFLPAFLLHARVMGEEVLVPSAAAPRSADAVLA